MSLLSRIGATLDRWCGAYGNFVNQLGGPTLQFLAIVTVISGVYFFSCSEVITKGNDTINMISFCAFIYVLAIAAYIRYGRSNEPNTPPPIQFPNLGRFFRSVIHVAALVFFFACDEPMKSVRNFYIPCICISAYLHILVVLVILRRKNDYGFSDGFLAAAFGLLFPMCDTYELKAYLILSTFLLFGMRNLQLHTLNPPISPIHNPVDQLAITMSHMTLTERSSLRRHASR